MKSIDELGIVIDYIEKNITEVKFSDISKLVGIPIGLYQRIFSYICGISISEYIRKRKLTMAADELLMGLDSIIDIALKYGYESHSAFTRAFREQFNVPPSGITCDIFKNNAYKGLSFDTKNDTYYVVKGKRVMADLTKIEYEQMNSRKLIGISSLDTGKTGRGLWDIYFESGSAEKLESLKEYQCNDMEDYIGLGYACNFDETGKAWEYTVGKYFDINTPVPNGMTSIIIPSGIIAKAQIKGRNFDEILENAYILITDIIQKNGYQVDYNNFYWSEVYTYSRFCEPIDSGSSEVICDWFIPCKNKSENI